MNQFWKNELYGFLEEEKVFDKYPEWRKFIDDSNYNPAFIFRKLGKFINDEDYDTRKYLADIHNKWLRKMATICNSKFNFTELWADFASKNNCMSQFCNVAFSFERTFREQCEREYPLFYANIIGIDLGIISKWQQIVLDIINKFE